MTPGEAKDKVGLAAQLRMPRWDPASPLGPHEKIEKLEKYLLECSFWRGELEEAELFVSAAVHELRVKWEMMDGYEGMLGRVDADKATGPQHRRAKMLHDPDLFRGISDGKHLLERIARQIRRLEKDEDVASRAYTLLTGG